MTREFDRARYVVEYKGADWEDRRAEFVGTYADMLDWARKLSPVHEWAWDIAEAPAEELLGQSFEVLTAETAWDGYNWGGDLDASHPVYRRCFAANSELVEVFIGNDGGRYSDAGPWCCEIDENGLAAQAWGATPEEALAAAYVDWRGYDYLDGLDDRERDPEDATNVVAYYTAAALLGRSDPFPVDDVLMSIVNETYLPAHAYVREHGAGYGIEWEEF